MQRTVLQGLSVPLSVSPSVCQTRTLWQNETNLCPHFYTTWKIIHLKFLTRKMVGEGDFLYLNFWNFAGCAKRLAFVRCTEVIVTWFCLRPVVLLTLFTSTVCCIDAAKYKLVSSCKTRDRLESIGIVNSPNSIALQADHVTVVEDSHIMSAKYRLPVIFRQNWSTQQSHGIFATAKLLVLCSVETGMATISRESERTVTSKPFMFSLI